MLSPLLLFASAHGLVIPASTLVLPVPTSSIVQSQPVFTTGDLASPYLGTQEQQPSLFPTADVLAAQQPSYQSLIFPTSTNLAALQPDWLGAPAANKANPGGAGNAEGNWWTPSSALDTDCDGNKVTARTKLTQECIYQKKTAEIRARQAISSENARYKVERLEDMEKKAADAKALREQKLAAQAAKQAKYAAKTRPAR